MSDLETVVDFIASLPAIADEAARDEVMRATARYRGWLVQDGWADDGSITGAVLTWAPGDQSAAMWGAYGDGVSLLTEYGDDTWTYAEAWGSILHAAAVHGGVDTSLWQTAEEWTETCKARQEWLAYLGSDEQAAEVNVEAPAVFKPMSLADMRNRPSAKWIIDGILQARSLAVAYGARDQCKSFLAISMGLHIAAGLPFADRAVDQGGVVYLAAEDADGVAARAEGAIRQYGMSVDLPFWVLATLPRLGDPKQMAQLAIDLKRFAGEVPIRLLIVDTYARAMEGLDENHAGQTAIAVGAFTTLARSLGCAILPVHHTGINGRLRGSNALPAAADAVFRIDRKTTRTGDVVSFTNEKQKNATRAGPLYFDMLPAHGTLVAVPRDKPEPAPKAAKGARTAADEAAEQSDLVPAKPVQAAPEPVQAATPLATFVAARCVRGNDRAIDKAELFDAYAGWCERESIDQPTAIAFGRDLLATVPDVGARQYRNAGKRVWQYSGIALR